MSEFIKYNSIENSYRQGFLDKCALAIGDAKVVALEKVHGANFSWAVDANGVRVAKRSGLIEELETFYGHTRFYAKYEPIVLALFAIIRNDFPNAIQINLFGEVFGGCYNGVTTQSAKKVQSGVNYHPDNEFMAFDLRVTFDTGVSRYISYYDMKELISDANFLSRTSVSLKTAPVVGIGTLEEIIAIDPLFYTKVPQVYGLDDSHEKTNADYAEGFVIRGMFEDFYVGNERVILKQKNALYGEKEKTVKIKAAVSLDDEQQDFLDTVCSYITENRVKSVASKDTYVNFGKLQGDVVRDALEDYAKDVGSKATDNEHWSFLAKRVGGYAAQVVRPVWVQLDN